MFEKFQLLSCDIALGGDILNVVSRHAFIPVTYPEMLVLKYLHGENAVTNIFDVGYVEREERAEYARLVETYKSEVISEKLFPGAGTRLPHGDNRYAPRVVGTKINPGVAPVPSAPDLPAETTGTFETPVPAEPDSVLTDATAPQAAGTGEPAVYGDAAADGYTPAEAPTNDSATVRPARRGPTPVAAA